MHPDQDFFHRPPDHGIVINISGFAHTPPPGHRGTGDAVRVGDLLYFTLEREIYLSLCIRTVKSNAFPGSLICSATAEDLLKIC
ncbi:hypothetical protein RJ40_00330 [Methanofollis aquaemaris]|uniref:Uncharacterized protein n=1 Tax=Methanofollis aquaemaris TaxID=126734 RepID=A0A8A3S334_9EURY|nr:hypothetical protein [Methanofollis aquaemaris]QSZ66056.1 hypothetical protein RJ40_00330 [Methanofollis aquaemaris]